MNADSVARTIKQLGHERAVYHSEADLQLAYGIALQRLMPDANIRLETRPWGRDENTALDVEVIIDGRRTAIEMKYLTKSFSGNVDGEEFNLKTHSAHDIRRYDIIKDLCRVETLVLHHGFEFGHVIVVSNDPAYWNDSKGRDTIDREFRIHDGAVLEGSRAWNIDPLAKATGGKGTGTSKGRHDLALAGTYVARWEDFSETTDPKATFRLLVLSCGPGPGLV